MARSIFASFLFFVALVIGVTSSNAQGGGIGVGTLVRLNVTGRIVCNPLGNVIPILPNRPVVGVNVTLSCDNRRTIVAQAVTNTMGFFQLTANASNINNIGNCRVFVPLPINGNCIFLRASGSLQASILLTDIIQTVTGVVLNFATLAFAILPF